MKGLITIFYLLLSVFVFGQAGPDQVCTMPFNTVTITASGGVTYAWTQILRPTRSGGIAFCTQEGKITSASSASTTITNLGVGTYQYRVSINAGLIVDTVTVTGYAQSSGTCWAGAHTSITVTATSANELYYPNIASYGLKGGDTIHIPAGTWNLIQFGTSNDPSKGLLGDSCNYIQIVPDGVVNIVYAGQAPMWRFYSCRFFHLDNRSGLISWTGDSGDSDSGLSISSQSSDYLVDNGNWLNCGNAVFSKNNIDTTNALTYNPNWFFKNCIYQDLYMKGSEGEAMYMGNTFSPFVYGYVPTSYWNLTIQRSRVDSSGWDGFQVSVGRNVYFLYDTVYYSGLANLSSQMYGIISGGLVNSTIDNCLIYGSKSSGIAILGNDSCIVTNTRVDSTSKGSVDGAFSSIYINDNAVSGQPSPSPSLVVRVQNNCITNVSSYTGGAAIRSTNNNGTTRAGYIQGNTIYDPLGRALSNLISDDGVGDTISGNTLGSCATAVAGSRYVTVGRFINIVH